MPIITASNALPPEPTSRVVTWRSLPSSRIVYFTLIPVFAVKSDGVNDAMSCICGFATIATLIVFAAVLPVAVAARNATAAILAASTPTTASTGGRLLPFRASCMVDASSGADGWRRDSSASSVPLRLGRLMRSLSDDDRALVRWGRTPGSTPESPERRSNGVPESCVDRLEARVRWVTITLSARHCQEPLLPYTISAALGTQGETSLSKHAPTNVRRPTMLDVAALAGVGLKTVSRVVNGEPGVSANLETKVRRAIEQLNYRRDANASMLRRLGGKTQTIGLVLEDVANPFSSALHRAIEDSARTRNVLVFAGSCDEDPRRERELIGSFRDRRVDGVLVVAAGPDHTYLYVEQRAGTALVFVDRPAGHLDANTVGSDNVGGARIAVAHLLGHGHRRIAFLGDLPTIFTARERLRGYKEALASAGVDVDEDLIRTGLRDPQLAAQAVEELLSLPNPPTALFTSQNFSTI